MTEGFRNRSPVIAARSRRILDMNCMRNSPLLKCNEDRKMRETEGEFGVVPEYYWISPFKYPPKREREREFGLRILFS